MEMKLYKCAKDCAKQFSMLDFGFLKLCVGSAGLIAGLLIPKKKRSAVLPVASIIFSLTLFPLLFKFVRSIADNDRRY